MYNGLKRHSSYIFCNFFLSMSIFFEILLDIRQTQIQIASKAIVVNSIVIIAIVQFIKLSEKFIKI